MQISGSAGDILLPAPLQKTAKHPKFYVTASLSLFLVDFVRKFALRIPGYKNAVFCISLLLRYPIETGESMAWAATIARAWGGGSLPETGCPRFSVWAVSSRSAPTFGGRATRQSCWVPWGSSPLCRSQRGFHPGDSAVEPLGGGGGHSWIQQHPPPPSGRI